MQNHKITCSYISDLKAFGTPLQHKVCNLLTVIQKPLDCPKNRLPGFNFSETESDIRKAGYVNHTQHAILVDFDSGYTIDAFKNKFEEFEFYLYTTSSHTNDFNKFRAIFILNESIPYTSYTDARLQLKYKFRGADQTTFDTNRFFYIPSLPSNPSDYIWIYNEGRRLDFYTDILPLKKYTDQQNLFKNPPKPVKEYTEEYAVNWDKCEQELFDILSKGDNTGRYSKVMSWIGVWKTKSKGDTQTIKNILERSRYHNFNALRGMLK